MTPWRHGEGFGHCCPSHYCPGDTLVDFFALIRVTFGAVILRSDATTKKTLPLKVTAKERCPQKYILKPWDEALKPRDS